MIGLQLGPTMISLQLRNKGDRPIIRVNDDRLVERVNE